MAEPPAEAPTPTIGKTEGPIIQELA